MAFEEELAGHVAQIAADRESGASQLVVKAIAVLRAALMGRIAVAPLARALCQAQPSMGCIWNVALQAVAAERDPTKFERVAERIARAPRALTRFAAAWMDSTRETRAARAAEPRPLRVVTISASSSVVVVIVEAQRLGEVEVSCSESRPGLEGRRLAAELASKNIQTTVFGDAAIAHALPGADAVLVGADAIGPESFLNKSGTRMLAAAAGLHGVPVYVAATHDKFVGPATAARLQLREGAPAEIWDRAPSRVTVRNPYFEATPLDLVTGVISDIGLLGAGMVPDVCRAAEDAAILTALQTLDVAVG